MDKFFNLKGHHTTVRTEFFAGLTTFMTMAYILVVNPNILAATGMDKGALFTATALAAIIGSLLMGIIANYPFALAPGMGLNAFFAFSVVGVLVDTWQQALTAIFVEGLIFLLLTLFRVREALFDSIPANIKFAVSAGIGIFIAFIGFVDSGIVVADEATLVRLGDLHNPATLMALMGVIIMAVLVILKVRGAILLGILATWGMGVVAQMTGWYVVDVAHKSFSVIPSGTLVSMAPPVNSILFKCFDFTAIMKPDFWIVVFAFFFVDLFDNLGTLIGVSAKAGFLDKEHELPRLRQALFADAIAASAGAMCGTSTTTTYVESAAGVADGGRTGLTAVFVAFFFFLALFLSPVFLVIPSFATAPALIVVGFLMADSFTKINFHDASEGIPAFLTAVVMPLTYSISEGIMFGVISYTVLKLATGKAKLGLVLKGKDKQLHWVMIVLTILFIGRYIVLK